MSRQLENAEHETRAAPEPERRGVEDELRRSAERAALVQSVAHLGSWEWSLADNRIWWSEQMFRLHGHAPNAFEPSYEAFFAHVHPDDLGAVRAAADRLADPKWQSPGVEYRIIRADGGIRVMYERIRIMRDEHGHPRRVIGAVLDVTERRRVDEVIGMLARSAGEIPLDQFMTDCVRQLTEVYGARYAFVGRLVETDRGRMRTLAVWAGGRRAENFPYDLRGTPCQDILDRKMELIPRDAWKLYPDDVMLKDMEVESYFGAPLLAADGRVLGIVSVLDVKAMEPEPWTRPVLGVYATRLANEIERAEALEELRRSRGRLEERVLERTAELEALNRELEAFTYSVSHDLRAPLRAIDGFSRALEEDCAAKLDDAGRAHLMRVRRATHHMGELIDALLGLSRLTRTELKRERVNLSALAHEVAASLRETAPERKVQFDVAPGLEACADRALMRIVLDNLLGNAFKYTTGCEHARIGLSATERNAERVYCVADNGVGFDMQYAGRLFGAFQRLHASSRFDGLGIGLATVQRIVHRHGGRVWAEAAPEQGARFYFTLGVESCADRGGGPARLN